MTKLVLPTDKERLILEMLANNGPMYGKQMMVEEPSLKHGTIYPTLYRMKSRGYVRTWRERNLGERGIGRRMYRIEVFGQRVLNATRAAETAFAEFVPKKSKKRRDRC